jgi:hypothetical protein
MTSRTYCLEVTLRAPRCGAAAGASARSCSAVAPEGGDWDGLDAVAEGACALTEVEDHAGGATDECHLPGSIAFHGDVAGTGATMS